jgi:hypothetical protein
VTGAAVLSIPDAAGELVAYRLEPALAGLSAWAVTVTRLDSGDSYRVSLERDGSWRCGCEDFLYRGRPRKKLCKHCLSIKTLKAFWDSFAAPQEAGCGAQGDQRFPRLPH